MRQSYILCLFVALVALVPNVIFAEMTSPTGGNQPHSNLQPLVGMNYIVRTSTGDIDNLGDIKLFAGDFAPAGWTFANGTLLSTATNPTLFQRIGTTYGGNGITTFALPDLRDRLAMHQGTGADLTPRSLGEQVGEMSSVLTVQQMPAHAHTLSGGIATNYVGGNAPMPIMQPSLAINYSIAAEGIFPTSGSGNAAPGVMLGQVRMNASNTISNSDLRTDGQTMAISQNDQLYSILGTTYGGNGTTSFKLPDLRGRVPLGVGQGTGLTNRVLGQQLGAEDTTLTLNQLPAHAHSYSGGITGTTGAGQPYDNMQPSLGLNYIIATNGGIYPSRSGDTQDGIPILGEVALFAGNFVPQGWHACDGSLLSIQSNTALYSLLGVYYGGDGRTTFALPDLRGSSVAGSGINFEIGSVDGFETNTLNLSELPAHEHFAPEPASIGTIGIASLLFLSRRRRVPIAR